MPPRPKTGDLVKVLGQTHHVEATRTGVVLRSQYSWASMGDVWIIQVGDTRVHAPREKIQVISRA